MPQIGQIGTEPSGSNPSRTTQGCILQIYSVSECFALAVVAAGRVHLSQ